MKGKCPRKAPLASNDISLLFSEDGTCDTVDA